MIPHPAKKHRGGEDSYFVCTGDLHGQGLGQGLSVTGVADGVGGWANHGVDAGLYARELMSHCFDYFCHTSEMGDAASSSSCCSPSLVAGLEYAHGHTTCLGSSTACLVLLEQAPAPAPAPAPTEVSTAAIEPVGYLHSANLGDSGYLLLRPKPSECMYEVVYESEPQVPSSEQ